MKFITWEIVQSQNQQEMWVLKEEIDGCYINWSYLVRRCSDSDWPQREKDAISHKDADHPDDGEAEADVAEILVGSGEEVPRGQFLWGEALRHLVVRDALQALLAEVEGVTQRKLPRRQRLGPAQLLHFLLHWSAGTLDDAWTWQQLTVRPARSLALTFILQVRFGLWMYAGPCKKQEGQKGSTGKFASSLFIPLHTDNVSDLNIDSGSSGC